MRRASIALTTGSFTCATIFLAGCGDQSADKQADDSNEASGSWREADVCALVGEDQVVALLGEAPTPVAKADAWQAPACSWGETSTYGTGVRVRLWDPPEPSIFDRYDEISIEGLTTHKVSERDFGCELEIEADPAWVTVDVDLGIESEVADPCLLAGQLGAQLAAAVNDA